MSHMNERAVTFLYKIRPFIESVEPMDWKRAVGITERMLLNLWSEAYNAGRADVMYQEGRNE